MITPSAQPSQDTRRVVALAVLHREDQFLVQLRDDKPDILYPGHWGLFGGHIESGETPDQGIQRELLEEIGYCPAELRLIRRYADTSIRFAYYGVLEVDPSQLVQMEGMDMALISAEDVRRGDRFSDHMQQVRAIAKPARQILLDVIESNYEL